MKKLLFSLVLTVFLVSILSSCSSKDYSGTFVGYSWQGEATGVKLDDATQKIQTTLTLDKKGDILEAKISFLVKNNDGNWVRREDPSAEVEVDFSVTPTKANLPAGDTEYKHGDSMLKIKTVDKMAFFAVAVSDDGVIAFAIVEPYTRFQFEYKMESDFDFSTPMKDFTIGSGLAVPTVRTSAGGYTKPSAWDDYSDYNVLSFHPQDPYILVGRGVFDGLTANSSIKDYLEKAGVSFEDGKPQPLAPVSGFTGIGGWKGNYESVSKFLVGQNARIVTSLVNWDNSRYKAGINDDNFFGLDDISGATKTVQSSLDGISGATVRISRESTSYQRALVEAGILKEEDVIKGRF